jgi:hypothetical protein
VYGESVVVLEVVIDTRHLIFFAPLVLGYEIEKKKGKGSRLLPLRPSFTFYDDINATSMALYLDKKNGKPSLSFS